jgi:hypothetical protein
MGGFWGTYLGNNNTQDQSAAQFNTVTQCEMKAMGLIWKTVTPIIALEIHGDIIPNTTTSPPTMRKVANTKELLMYLTDKYQKKDAVLSLLKYCQLLCATLVNNGTLEAQLNNLIDLCSHCALHLLKLNDFQFTTIILISLPKSYSHITDSLLAHGKIKDLKVKEVHTKITETKIRRNSEHNPTANALYTSATKKKNVPKVACYHCRNKGHWANCCPSKVKPTTTSSSPNTAGPSKHKVKEKQGNSHTLNVVESDSESDLPIHFYVQSDASLENWLMDSGTTDHMTPFGFDFKEYATFINSKNSVLLGDGTTYLQILGKGTIKHWAETMPSHYTPLVMENVLHIQGIKQ